MSRYAGVGNNNIVVRSRFKHTAPTIEEPTKKQKEAHKNKMQKDLIAKYEMINTLSDLGLLEVVWHDGFVEFSKTINGVDYERYIEWYKEQMTKGNTNEFK